MKKIVCMFLLFALMTPLTACSNKITKDNLPANSVYSTSLGKVISLGMTKEQVDNELGEGKLEFEKYTYQPDNLSIGYIDGKVHSISLEYPNTDWITKGKFTVGTARKDIISANGNSYVKNNDNELFYYFSSKNEFAKSKENTSYGVLYTYNDIDDKVKGFMIEEVDSSVLKNESSKTTS